MVSIYMDDTNPAREEVEYVEAIKEDVNWPVTISDRFFYASDYFEDMYQFAVELIEKVQPLLVN